MNPVPRETDDETKKAIEDYLKKGGKITVFPPGQRSEDIEYTGGFYGRKKKKANKEK